MHNATRVPQRAHEPELPDKTGEHGRRREGISWSFLTWGFFLSQSIAAEQALAAAARPIDESADLVSRRTAGGETGVPTSQRTADMSAQSATEAGGGSIGQPHAAGAMDSASRLGAVQAQDAEWRDVENGLARHMASASGGTASQGLLADTITVAPSAGLPTLPGANPIGGDVFGPVIGIVDGVLDAVLDPLGPAVGEVLQPVLDVVRDITSPIFGIVDNALTTVLPLLNNVVPPIVGSLESITEATESVLDSATQLGSIVGNVADALQPDISETLAPLEEVAGSAAAALSGLVEPVVDGAGAVISTTQEVASDVQGTMQPLVDHTLGSAIDLTGAVAGEAAEAVEPVLEGMLTPLAESIPVPPAAGMAGFIDATWQADAPLLASAGLSAGDTVDVGLATGTPALELFSRGNYTDYALALHSQVRTDDGVSSGNIEPDGAGAVPTLTDAMHEDAATQPIENLFGIGSAEAGDRVFHGFGL